MNWVDDLHIQSLSSVSVMLRDVNRDDSFYFIDSSSREIFHALDSYSHTCGIVWNSRLEQRVFNPNRLVILVEK